MYTSYKLFKEIFSLIWHTCTYKECPVLKVSVFWNSVRSSRVQIPLEAICEIFSKTYYLDSHCKQSFDTYLEVVTKNNFHRSNGNISKATFAEKQTNIENVRKYTSYDNIVWQKSRYKEMLVRMKLVFQLRWEEDKANRKCIALYTALKHSSLPYCKLAITFPIFLFCFSLSYYNSPSLASYSRFFNPTKTKTW